MKYSEETIGNQNFLKRFSHKSRFKESAKLLNSYKDNHNTSILDFGSGNGYFIKYLIDKKFIFDFSAYDADPEDKQITEMKKLFFDNNIENVNIYNDYNLIQKKFNIISCLETLEHFNQIDQKKLLIQMKNLLNEDGIILISVPIEVYFSGFLKMIFRFLINQSQENSSISNIFNTLFGRPINSIDNIKTLKTQDMQYRNTHVGFYYFNLINLIKSLNFKIEEIRYSPFPFLKSYLNSQIFLKLSSNK